MLRRLSNDVFRAPHHSQEPQSCKWTQVAKKKYMNEKPSSSISVISLSILFSLSSPLLKTETILENFIETDTDIKLKLIWFCNWNITAKDHCSKPLCVAITEKRSSSMFSGSLRKCRYGMLFSPCPHFEHATGRKRPTKRESGWVNGASANGDKMAGRSVVLTCALAILQILTSFHYAASLIFASSCLQYHTISCSESEFT